MERTDPGSFRRLLALPGGMGPASMVIHELHLPAQPRLTFQEQLPCSPGSHVYSGGTRAGRDTGQVGGAGGSPRGRVAGGA